MLQDVIGEEACVYVLGQELSELEDELVLHHLQLNLPFVQINDYNVDEFLLFHFHSGFLWHWLGSWLCFNLCLFNCIYY